MSEKAMQNIRFFDFAPPDLSVWSHRNHITISNEILDLYDTIGRIELIRKFIRAHIYTHITKYNDTHLAVPFNSYLIRLCSIDGNQHS